MADDTRRIGQFDRPLARREPPRGGFGLSQVDLARRLRRPQSFVSKYESGQRRLDLIELRAISRALGVDLLDLVRRFEAR
jgi:transcriptional regulator with XRE-family HTH domain